MRDRVFGNLLFFEIGYVIGQFQLWQRGLLIVGERFTEQPIVIALEEDKSQHVEQNQQQRGGRRTPQLICFPTGRININGRIYSVGYEKVCVADIPYQVLPCGRHSQGESGKDYRYAITYGIGHKTYSQ